MMVSIDVSELEGGIGRQAQRSCFSEYTSWSTRINSSVYN